MIPTPEALAALLGDSKGWSTRARLQKPWMNGKGNSAGEMSGEYDGRTIHHRPQFPFWQPGFDPNIANFRHCCHWARGKNHYFALRGLNQSCLKRVDTIVQEFLGWTLDDLHEDLNKAQKKRYREVCGNCEARALC